MTVDEEIALLRCYVHMGHTAGKNTTDNTCFTPFFPDCFKFMRYNEVIKIVHELEVAHALGSLSTTEKYMYWFLNENGIITALSETARLKAEYEALPADKQPEVLNDE